MARRGRVPVNDGYNGASVFIKAYKGVEEPKPNYNVIPGQCILKRGLSLRLYLGTSLCI